MITLHQYEYCWGINASPFCLKIEVYLRALGIPFTSDTGRQQAEPKGKRPFITHKGRVIADSEFIIEYIENTFGKSLNSGLNEEQKAISRAFKKMVEEHLYWCLVANRWFSEQNANEAMQAYFGGLPPEAVARIRHKTRRDLDGSGIGLHSEEEIEALGIKDLMAIEAMARGKNGFIFGELSEPDVVFYAFLTQIFESPANKGKMQDYCLNSPVLSGYFEFLKNLWAKK